MKRRPRLRALNTCRSIILRSVSATSLSKYGAQSLFVFNAPALANAIDEKDNVIEGPTAPQSAALDSSSHPSPNSTRYTVILYASTPVEIPSKRRGCDKPRWCTPVFVKE